MAQQIKPSKALVVIDMQPNFSTAAPIIPQVVELVKSAIKEEKRILIVEFAHHEKTHEEILKEVQNYKKVKIIKKSSNDGSNEVMKALGPRPIELEVCGVNLGACVQATVAGLSNHGSVKKITLVAKATNDGFGSKNAQLKWYYRKPKIKVRVK
jgi:nicotinamidase-related amidase